LQFYYFSTILYGFLKLGQISGIEIIRKSIENAKHVDGPFSARMAAVHGP
jgi:hypothetical protein